METLPSLCLWLQEWQLSHGSKDLAEAWTLYPKGTEVYFVSNLWLQHIWTLVKDASSVPSIEASLQDFPLDNSDILNPDLPNQLKLGVCPIQHFAVIPKETFCYTFSRFRIPPEQLVKGFVVWDGLLHVSFAVCPYRLPCILEYKQQLVMEEIVLDSNITVKELKNRLLRTNAFVLPKDIKITLWNGQQSCPPAELLQSLTTNPVISNVSGMSVLKFKARAIFNALNSQLIFAQFHLRSTSFFDRLTLMRPKTVSVGLRNLGNTCYLNSVLQCIAHVNQLAVHIFNLPGLSESKDILWALQTLVTGMFTRNISTFNPEEVHAAIAVTHDYTRKQQEDAHEVFNLILGLLHERVHPSTTPTMDFPPLQLPNDPQLRDAKEWLEFLRGASVLTGDIFGGLHKHKMQCGVCGHLTYRFSPFHTLSLNLPATRTFSITLIALNPRQSPIQFQIQSSTPVESNESIHNIWQQVAAYQNINHFIVGEHRNKLFRGPIGLSNIASLNGYLVIELPEFDPEKSLFMMDVFNVNGSGESKPVATRVVQISSRVKLEDVLATAITYLVDVQESITGFQSMVSNILGAKHDPIETFHLLNNRATFHPTTLDWGKPSLSPLDIDKFTTDRPLMTIGDLCDLSENRIPRFRLLIKDLPSSLSKALRCPTPGRSFFLGDFQDSTSDKNITLTVLQMLEYTLNDKPLNEEDLVTCESCGRDTQHIAALQIAHLPRVLVLVLQRVRLQSNGLKKSSINIQYPDKNLDLSQFEKGPACDPPIYDLIGVVHHHGNLAKGHYTAHAKHPATDRWFFYDDTTTEAVEAQDALDEKHAYLLFYSRHV